MQDVLILIGIGIVFVGGVVLLWYLQPPRLPANPETDGDIRPPSERARTDISIARVLLNPKGEYIMPPRPEISGEERDRQALLGRSEDE